MPYFLTSEALNQMMSISIKNPLNVLLGYKSLFNFTIFIIKFHNHHNTLIFCFVRKKVFFNYESPSTNFGKNPQEFSNFKIGGWKRCFQNSILSLKKVVFQRKKSNFLQKHKNFPSYFSFVRPLPYSFVCMYVYMTRVMGVSAQL